MALAFLLLEEHVTWPDAFMTVGVLFVAAAFIIALLYLM